MSKAKTGERLTEMVNGHIAELQAQLAEGHTEHYLKSLEWFSRLHRYSWANALLIIIQRPDATMVAGYKKWAELGFQVRRGEKGIAIRAPWIRKEVDPETGEIDKRLVGYLGVYVFDISQTLEWPDKQPPPLEQDIPGDFEGLYDHLRRMVVVNGLELIEKPLPQRYDGFYVNNAITINSSLSTYLKVTTLIHEYLHAIAHSGEDAWDKWTRQEMEWQAESVSFTVCAAIGVRNVNARDYLLSHKLTTDKLAEIIKTIQTLTKRVMADLDLLQPIAAPAQLAEAC